MVSYSRLKKESVAKKMTWQTILYFVFIFGMMYLLLIRPQQKRAKEQQSMMAGMRVGDKVVTIGGLHGVIDEIDEVKNTITLNCEGIFLEFDRRSIARTEKADPANTALINDTVSDAAEAEARENEIEAVETDAEQNSVEKE